MVFHILNYETINFDTIMVTILNINRNAYGHVSHSTTPGPTHSNFVTIYRNKIYYVLL